MLTEAPILDRETAYLAKTKALENAWQVPWQSERGNPPSGGTAGMFKSPR
jgi:hypothetical protein